MNFLAQCMVLLILPMTSVGRTLNSRNDCSAAVEPTNLPEQLTAYLSEVLHESLHILPPREQLISTELAKSNTSTRNWIYGSRACPDSFAELNGSGIKAERSICPFHYEMDYDETRFPKNLYTAKCNDCNGCVGTASSDAMCEPVYYNVRVLRRNNTCSNGFFNYEHGWHRLTVGCSCNKRPTAPGPL